MTHPLYGGRGGLLGLWLWDCNVRIPKGDLGARVHTLWILRAPQGTKEVTRYYAGYVVIPGVKTVSQRFKDILEWAMLAAEDTSMGPKELRRYQYLEDPLCGDVGSFPLRFKGHPARVAKAFIKRLHRAGHDLAALSPAPFREIYARRTGRTRS